VKSIFVSIRVVRVIRGLNSAIRVVRVIRGLIVIVKSVAYKTKTPSKNRRGLGKARRLENQWRSSTGPPKQV
jgi:hypothetical protein